MKIEETLLEETVHKLGGHSKVNVTEVIRENLETIRKMKSNGAPIHKISEAISEILGVQIKPESFAATFSRIDKAN